MGGLQRGRVGLALHHRGVRPSWLQLGDQLARLISDLPPLPSISALCFVPAAGSHPGFSLDYPSITLHAISRDDSGPSIYCQLDESPAAGQSVPRPTRIIEGRENDGHYHPEDEEDDDSPMREMRILVDESDGQSPARFLGV